MSSSAFIRFVMTADVLFSALVTSSSVVGLLGVRENGICGFVVFLSLAVGSVEKKLMEKIKCNDDDRDAVHCPSLCLFITSLTFAGRTVKRRRLSALSFYEIHGKLRKFTESFFKGSLWSNL